MVARTVVAGIGALLLAGCGISGNFRHDPGYAAFAAPRALDREFGISLGPLPLRIARLVLDDDAEIGPILKELRAVRVYSYNATDDAQRIAQALNETRSRLVDDGWISLVVVREDQEFAAVLLRADEAGRHRGLAVISQDPTEVVLVNLIGNVRLDLFTEYMTELGVETPGIEIDPQTLRARAQ